MFHSAPVEMYLSLCAGALYTVFDRCYVRLLVCDSERELIWDTAKFLKVVGECAGEVGDHGKWFDTMFPFVKRYVCISACEQRACVVKRY